MRPATGEKELWKQISPPDPAGITSVSTVQLTPDLKSYFYTYQRDLSDLYLVEGLR